MNGPESANDREWISAAVDRYERPLMCHALRYLGDVERSREVVQDTFLKMWQVERCKIEAHLGKWLYTVCRNRALDELRKDGRMKSAKATLSAREAGRSPWNEPSPHHESRDRVLHLLEQLPQRQQEIIRLRFQGGLSYREISEVTSLTVSHVGVLLHNAIKTLREQLGAGEGDLIEEPMSHEIPRGSS